jgi:hypothetical protein
VWLVLELLDDLVGELLLLFLEDVEDDELLLGAMFAVSKQDNTMMKRRNKMCKGRICYYVKVCDANVLDGRYLKGRIPSFDQTHSFVCR